MLTSEETNLLENAIKGNAIDINGVNLSTGLRCIINDWREMNKALSYYAIGEHLSCFDDWDSVSGEPENFIVPSWGCEEKCKACEDRPEIVETGKLAKQVLDGYPFPENL